MSFSAATCPKCKEYILQKDNVPFLVCPACEGNISARESLELLNEQCSDPKNINKIIAKCLELERLYGSELPYKILVNVAERFPFNEEVAYLLVAMGDYDSMLVRDYLSRFSGIKKEVPFAEEFLENAMTFRNIAMGELFEQYIENKLAKNKTMRFCEKLRSMQSTYKGKSDSPMSIRLLYVYYIAASLINIAMAIIFIVLDIYFWWTILIVVIAFAAEIGILFLHNRKFGNRLNVVGMERHLMVAFMCTIIVAIGGLFLGMLW